MRRPGSAPRRTFGAELRLGNGNGADGTLMLYLDPPHDSYAMRQFQTMGELNYIAMRKQQALAYIAGGLTHQEAAARMGVSKATLDTYVTRVRTKLQLGNKAELALAALRYVDPQHRVVVPDPRLTRARLELCRAARVTLKVALDLMGVSAPERM